MNWLIDYDHPVDMSREYYRGWRPAYTMLDWMESPTIAEIGVFEGFNTFLAMKFFDIGKYYLIDPYKEYNDGGELSGNKQEFWDNLYLRTQERFKDYKNVEFIRKTSEEACLSFPDESLDFVYIDGNHSYGEVWNDINRWWGKVKKGCYIAGHDRVEPEVGSAVYRFFLEKYGNDPSVDTVEDYFGAAYNDWWIKKK